jgi:DNA repair protein SbcC/Rad50
MIPVKLTIQGLYSYQKKQTIDFTKLTTANLFGIFGTVGSGKSSILEAVTFALYGKTDRLNLSGDNRNYNMMNLKSRELFIEFIFETGKEQTAYRTIVKGRRNTKRFEEVKTLERIAYQKINDKWVPIETSVLEDAIGLSYENFKRTIIIPQGKFQEFLQLGNRDRTRMMKDLFNLQKFELYDNASSLESKNNSRIQKIEGQLQQLGELNQEKVNEYEQQLIQTKDEIEKQTKKLNEHQKQEAQWQQIQKLAEKLKAAKDKMNELKKQEAEFIKLSETISKYENCLLRFKNILDAMEKSNKKINMKTKQIKSEANELKGHKEAITRKEIELSKIKYDYEKREIIKQRAEELSKLSEIKILTSNIEKDKIRLEKGNEILNQIQEAVKKLKEDKEKLEQSLKLKKSKLPDLNLLSKVKTWYVQKNNLDKQSNDLTKEINEFQKEKNKIIHEFRDILNHPLFDDLTVKSDITIASKYLQNKQEEVTDNITKLKREGDQLLIKEQLEKYAEDLREGQPCPLCGSTHHPEIYSAESIREEKSRLGEKKQILETKLENISNKITHFNDLQSQLKFNSRQSEQLSAKQKKLKKDIAEHVSAFKWDNYSNLRKVESAFDEADLIQKDIKNKESGLEKLSHKLNEALEKKERYQTEIENINKELTVNKTKTTTLEKQLIMVSPDQYINKSSPEIIKEQSALIQKYEEIDKQYNKLTEQLNGFKKIKDSLSGSLKANRKELEQEKEENELLLEQLEKELEKSEYTTAEEVKQILSQPIELESQKQMLSRFNENIKFSQNQLDQLQKEMGDRVYDAEIHKNVIKEISIIQKLLTEKNQEYGKIHELLNKLLKDLESRSQLKKSLESLQLRADNIKTLKNLFKGSGFVNYISSVYLQNLCNAANERFFQLTRQKLSLEITEDNNFQIRDYMNGGKVRNVKTLSGGQTFQAALSLALALADNIQKITESNQNFFFLDEGFGSLDHESLSVVFETLKSLRKENRIVGVISHVEDMQQEIDVHLRIENDEEHGSLIYESWKS